VSPSELRLYFDAEGSFVERHGHFLNRRTPTLSFSKHPIIILAWLLVSLAKARAQPATGTLSDTPQQNAVAVLSRGFHCPEEYTSDGAKRASL